MAKWLDKFMGNMSRVTSDKSDNYKSNSDLSLLSPSSMDVFGENLGNIPRSLSDKSDNNNLKPDLSLLSLPSKDIFDKDSLLHDFEERLAIAEVDGNQNPLQAHRIAYLDVFISILSALAENDPNRDWLNQKSKQHSPPSKLRTFRP